MSDNETKGVLSTRTVHELYCASVLIATIIILAAVQWYRIEKLVELISFSLTITSLVLAVIAIGYSIFSGSSIERGVHNLLIAVQSVRASATDIEALRDSLTREVRAVAAAVGSVASTVTQHSDVLATMAEQRSLAKSPPEHSSSAPAVSATTTTATVMSIIRDGSLAGAMGILALARCRESGTPVGYSSAFEGSFVDAPYVHGYLLALDVAGVFSAELTNETIVKVSTDLGVCAADVKAEIVKKIEGAATDGLRIRFQTGLFEIDEKLRAGPSQESTPPDESVATGS